MAIRESCQAARAGPPEIALGIAAEQALTGRMRSLFLGVRRGIHWHLGRLRCC
jgi:hypothetical protein